jgi:hypothetical protein
MNGACASATSPHSDAQAESHDDLIYLDECLAGPARPTRRGEPRCRRRPRPPTPRPASAARRRARSHRSTTGRSWRPLPLVAPRAWPHQEPLASTLSATTVNMGVPLPDARRCAVSRSYVSARLAVAWPSRRLSGCHTQQSIGPTGAVATAEYELTAADGRLLVTAGGVTLARLAFYCPDYVLPRGPNGEPSASRASFVRGAGGRVDWLRLGGRCGTRPGASASSGPATTTARRPLDPFHPWAIVSR